MIISDRSRLILYIVMGVCPIWSDWVAKSSDYSFRGMLMPILSSITAATAIALAKTSTRQEARKEAQPVEIVQPAGKPVPTHETAETTSETDKKPTP